MLRYMLLILTSYATLTRSNVGTTIFYKRTADSVCWTPNDLAKLRARKIFEDIMPANVPPDKINEKYIKELLRYYRNAMEVVDKQDVYNTGILQEALADAIGGHLKSKLLPTVRFAYYAGFVPFKSARQVHNFFEEIKNTLNSQGLGWSSPAKVPQWANISVVKILVGSGRVIDPCAYLILKRDTNDCIHFPLPKLDNYDNPSAVAFPFTFGGLVSLQAADSENILLKYYTTASRCVLRSSPQKCRHSDFVNLNNELWHWMKREVAPHLVDEKLYAAFGGILRIAAAVQSYGKGLSRRNLFEFANNPNRSMHWPTWDMLAHSSIYITTEWTPTAYIYLVCVVACLICLFQICFSRFFWGGSCSCSKKKRKCKADAFYANVEPHTPAILPELQEKVFYCFDKKQKRTPSKSSSVGSIRTQKVYDLNENTEKLMVIVSGNEDSDIGSNTSMPVSDDEELTKRSKSPPKLETPIAQLRLEVSPRGERRYEIPEFSTSTVTQSDFICTQQAGSESVWTGSASSTSDQSVSSTSSKSRRLRNDRDLAWARRVISKHATHTTKSSGDGTLDYHSFMMAAQRKQR